MHYSFIGGEVTSAVFWVSVCWAVMVMTGGLTYFKERESEEGVSPCSVAPGHGRCHIAPATVNCQVKGTQKQVGSVTFWDTKPSIASEAFPEV